MVHLLVARSRICNPATPSQDLMYLVAQTTVTAQGSRKNYSLISETLTKLRIVYNQLFFTNVLRLLDEQKMTKTELAEQAGISVSFLSDLTNGKANPSLKIMDAIARALGSALPTLLEISDLDDETLDILAGGKALKSLPDGYVRVSAILTEFQAFNVMNWDQENRKKLYKKR